jgi:UTP-glucose-1-phosphate uridylyltransferase
MRLVESLIEKPVAEESPSTTAIIGKMEKFN